MREYADLHVHTCLSDGSDTVREVLALASENNVSCISITDHNTVAAYTEAAFNEADRLGVKLIPGVELDVIHEGKQYHMLGLGIDYRNERLLEACAHPAEQIPYDQYSPDNSAFWGGLERLLAAGLEGIECIHPLHGFGLQRELIALCRERGLCVSGGTDYHGQFFSKQKQTIGGQFVSFDVSEKLLNKILY